MMKEILITSSALILALLLLRQVFRGVLSRRVQYALWGLVLVRLLVPVSLPAADFSVLTAAQPMEQAVSQRLDRIAVTPARPEAVQAPQAPLDLPSTLDHAQPEGPLPQIVEPGTAPSLTPAPGMTTGEVLTLVWKVGMALMGGFFLLSNLGFYFRLRKNRREWAGTARPYGVKRRVFLVPDGVLPSPCLFGWSIYITPAVASDPDKLRHVLAHEETHARHLDPVWSLLRCVCLTVYWFDPLVWAAALCAKTDCELACDEGVLKRLGESERIPYGQTLLSLIPVRKSPANPLLAATTMTAGKKQLKDRITRIAQKPRQLLAAALAVAVLAGVVSACTFTGAKPEATPAPTGTQEPQGLRALTGEELRWFNEEYFNHNPNPVISYTYSIRNQFANPINLYEKAEDIDLGELFYLEGSAPSNEELRTILGADPNDLSCPAYKLTTAEINDILRQYTGLTLEQMSGELRYTYDEDTDAWYWMHGDTNYCGALDFIVGTRENGVVKLYHNSDFAGSSWYCVTLKAQEDGSYWFLSNQACEAPAISTPLPAWEPTAVIDLSALEPYTAPVVTTERHEGDFVFSFENNIQNWNIDGHHIRIYRSTDGAVYAAEEQEDGTMNVFAQYSFDDVDMFFFHDLFGHDGFYITYQPGANARFYSTDTDYYYFDENGVLVLLAQCHGESQMLDLDGDGHSELIAPRQLFFQREGVVYEARLEELLMNACPELTYWDYESWDKYSRYLYVRGYGGEKVRERYLYFDGENILVYKNEKTATDHMVDGIDQGVPAEVVAQAKKFVNGLKWNEKDGTFANANYHHSSEARYDDWRVEAFYGPYTYSYGGSTVEAWQFNYEMHTITPEQIVLAGGKYITEDNWVSPGYPGTDTLFFLVDGDKRSYLNYAMIQEGMESYYVNEQVLQLMEEKDVELPDGSTYAQLNFRKHLDLLTDPALARNEMRIQYDDGQGNGGTYLIDPQEGNGSYYLDRIKDNYVVWSWAETPAADPTGPSVTFSSPDWYETLRFWQDSGLVMYKQENREPRWFVVQYDGDPTQDVYAYRAYPYYQARSWFDEAEYETLETELPLIPDGDQSYLNIVQEWAEAHEGLMTRLSPGSSMNCTYVKVTGAGTLEDMPETWFPADILDYPHFAFTYDVAFVPENQDALNTLMAGNTGEYEGGDPDVPQGAFTYSRRGSMYLKDGYWYCGSLGTG